MNARKFTKLLFVAVNHSKHLPISSLIEDVQKRKLYLELDDGSKFKIYVRPYRKAV